MGSEHQPVRNSSPICGCGTRYAPIRAWRRASKYGFYQTVHDKHLEFPKSAIGQSCCGHPLACHCLETRVTAAAKSTASWTATVGFVRRTETLRGMSGLGRSRPIAVIRTLAARYPGPRFTCQPYKLGRRSLVISSMLEGMTFHRSAFSYSKSTLKRLVERLN